MKIYRSDVDPNRPHCVDANVFGHPHPDEEGRMQYDNTCFKTEAEAWEKLVRESDAEFSLIARSIDAAREHLREVERESADATLRRQRILDGRAAFYRSAS